LFEAAKFAACFAVRLLGAQTTGYVFPDFLLEMILQFLA
jgi:hypothetical protein